MPVCQFYLTKCSESLLDLGWKIIMPKRNPVNSADDSNSPPKDNSDPLSVFLIISAKAYSSIGFGLSVLAIWMRWFLPDSAAPGQPVKAIANMPSPGPKTRSSSKLRALPRSPRVPPPTPMRRRSAPPTTTYSPVSILEHGSAPPSHSREPSGSSRRVYFADMQAPVSRRNTEPLERLTFVPEEETQMPTPIPSVPPSPLILSPILIESPLLTSLPVTNMVTPTPITTVAQDTPSTTINDENFTQPENEKTSTTPSSTPRQRKLRLSFTLRPKRNSLDKSREDPVVSQGS
ncbi:hypothetical protein CC1G_06589 [Coprinopsis cinerea okayama7|uniref:Uncharacterized protein n=1 Tax=Coprinopsis cinerea (strain Okayama-7 / 130 / ATCC MYA-4618 / FGSC 9003) TaxID=240176 RepID=A8N317_COPC7|nr:hypothetical protein CC1G_06589 [Coprinopsis cinerea okayama7\|eukprot:XP_001829252.2 hypothetical protein CC1G_06589 [Coprinopsis cinerea okayama7\